MAVDLTASHRVSVRVSAYYDGDLTAEDVPVLSGTVTSDATAAVARTLTVSVPIEWTPMDELDPLEKNGQELVVQRGAADPVSGALDVWELGTFRIERWSADAPTGLLTVEATGLGARLQEARLETPYSPAAGRTFRQVAEDLVDNLLPLEVDTALDSRTVPNGLTWEEDRLEALQELAATWPARMEVTPDGRVYIGPVYDPPSAADVLAEYADGERSVIVTYSPSGDREGYYNAVVARGQADSPEGKVTVQAAVYLTDYDGPYGRVPLFFESPLITTEAQARRAALARLNKVSRRVDRVTVTAVPDPARQLGDPVQVRLGERTWLGRVVAMTMPLGPEEPMTLTVEGEPR